MPDTSLQVSLQFYIQKINKLFTNETDLKPKHCYEWALTLFETSYLSKSIGNSPKELIYWLLSLNPSETLYDSDSGSGSLLSYFSSMRNSEVHNEPCLLVPPIGISRNLRPFDMVVYNYPVKLSTWPVDAVVCVDHLIVIESINEFKNERPAVENYVGQGKVNMDDKL